MAANHFDSTTSLWGGLAQPFSQLPGLGLMFSPGFTVGSPDSSLGFHGGALAVLQPVV